MQIIVLVCANLIMSECRGREAHQVFGVRPEERPFSSYRPLLHSGGVNQLLYDSREVASERARGGWWSRPGNRGSFTLHAGLGSAKRSGWTALLQPIATICFDGKIKSSICCSY